MANSIDNPLVIGRTRRQLEEAIKNANCELFEKIVRWVLQDEGYKSMGELVGKLKELEKFSKEYDLLISEIRFNKSFSTFNG